MTDPECPPPAVVQALLDRHATTADVPSIVSGLVRQRILDDLRRGPFGIGGPYPRRKLTRRDRIRFRIQGWRWSMRERIHDRLFPSCRHGEWR